MKAKKIKGVIYGGFKGECGKRNPWYIIPKPGEDGIFICDILKKYVRKKVEITIKVVKRGRVWIKN